MNLKKILFQHVSVMPKEVMENLALAPGMTVVDTTAGGGGHLQLIAEKVGPEGKVIALDRDLRAHEEDAAGAIVKQHKNIHLAHSSFSDLKKVLATHSITKVDALLCDLGISSPQIDDPARGFSFRHDGPIDMRMNPDEDISVYDLIRDTTEEDLANLIYKYGEERKSRRIARSLKKNWPLPNSTLALAEIVSKACGGRRGKIHPATRTFQALRIAANQELEELETLLQLLPEILAPKARAVFISFHSLEDRIIKINFKNGAAKNTETPPIWQLMQKRPLIPSEEETAHNPRSRSAKLRAVERLPDEPPEAF